MPKIALAQVNPTVGDLDENAALVSDWTAMAEAAGAEIVVFPELVLTGYPAEDLYLRPDFVTAAGQRLEEIAGQVGSITALIGFPDPVANPVGRAIAANAVAVVSDGEIRDVYRKRLLPNYGVFDEYRTFRNGAGPLVTEVAGSESRTDDLRGLLGSRIRRSSPTGTRSRPDRQPLGLALPPRQGPGAGGDLPPGSHRQGPAGGDGQHGRRPGRTDLRRIAAS